MSDRRMDFKWDVTPVQLGDNLTRKFGNPLRARIVTAVTGTGIEAAGQMKQRRPWRDITGNARRGLRCEVEATDGGRFVRLYFIHSVEYGKNLELGHAGRYAIIVPTMHQTVPRLERRLKNLI